jgi:SAM-dependent methyltransferase
MQDRPLTNADELRARFCDRLLELRPRSVLDVGCGAGGVLARCESAGIGAVGVEADPRSAGAAAVIADAARLPFPDASFDWVALRHVPHHLRDPGAGIAEALRVCESGALVAEPWFDPEIESQRVARRVDEWLKRQHRRVGRIHGPNLSPAELIALAPGELGVEADVAIALRLRPRPLDELTAEAEPLLAGLPPDHPERRAYERLLREIDGAGWSFNGSAIVTMRLRRR